MDIFKLFFNHDQRLDKLAKRNANKTEEEIEATLQDFMTPTPTFSKFYITGTRLQEEKFGLNRLNKYKEVMGALDKAVGQRHIHSPAGSYATLSEALDKAEIGQALVITEDEAYQADSRLLMVDRESNVGHLKDELRDVLMEGHWVLYKEQARDGYDLHLFSKQNIYPGLFHRLQRLTDTDFRFFSINSKRMRSEKQFYFETWTLDKPPHGAEEVFRDTTL